MNLEVVLGLSIRFALVVVDGPDAAWEVSDVERILENLVVVFDLSVKFSLVVADGLIVERERKLESLGLSG